MYLYVMANIRKIIAAEHRRNAVFIQAYARILKAKRRKMMAFVLKNMKGSPETIAANAASLVNEDYLEKLYKDMYTKVGGYWARRQYNNLLGQKADIRDAVWNIQLQQWVDTNTGELIKSVQGTMKKWVQAVVQKYVDEAMSEGIGLEKLTQEASQYLKGAYTGYEEWKVRQIISQEVLSAYSVSNEIGATSTGLDLKKTWIHSGAVHPHENHVKLDGETIRKEDDFDVGGYPAAFPRDQRLPASESINCMCAVVYRPV